jgi:hypothetical protein
MQTIWVEDLQSGPCGTENLDCLRKAAEQCRRQGAARMVLPTGVFEVGDAQAMQDLEALLSGRLSPYTLWKAGIF